MKREIKKVLIVVNLAKDEAHAKAAEVEAYLRSSDLEVVVHGFSGKPADFVPSNFDLAFSLGGDGTVLYSARLLGHLGIPILAVNIGDFGFITEVGKDEWIQAFEKYRDGLLGISERIMIATSVFRNGSEIASYNGLNDSVISSAGISKVVRLGVEIGDTTVGKYRADGVIISTPTGSTAYSAAAGGPILDPEMNALILNPICPFTLSNRPLVFPGSRPVFITLEERQRTDVIMTVDGQEVISLVEGDRVCFKLADIRVKIVRSDKRNFYEVLRSKLNWSGGPDA
ncbi:MAG: NAD(+)/NADH kinase [Spirochaetales bacterium]|nr:NAD(+)/NADH kinase [Spirochaetales bacterium]